MTRSSTPPRPASHHLKVTEDRLARLSVLQELTVAALDLFEPTSSVDPFLERLAERLGCLVAVWLAHEPSGTLTLVGAAGLAEASRTLPLEALRTGAEPWAPSFHYPEIARADLVRWVVRLDVTSGTGEGPDAADSMLLLWFDPERRPVDEYRPVVDRVVGVLGTVLKHRRLTSDLRASYEALARAQLALVERERLAAIGELSAVVAHEVRNPLAIMFNCIGTMQKGAAPPAETSALLGILAEEANRLNQLVSDLLEFARPGALSLREVSLEDILQGAVQSVRAAQPSPTDIELEIPEPLPRLVLDARLVRRAVVNLVTNAVQATPEGGRVVLRAACASHRGSPSVELEVTDDGPGVPSEVLSHIFEPFFTTRASGTGLGLAIVKQIAEEHRGEVSVRQGPGRGVTFVLALPISPARAGLD